MAELVDALDLGSSAARRESSSLSFRTIDKQPLKYIPVYSIITLYTEISLFYLTIFDHR